MNSHFQNALAFVFEIEGYVSDDPDDAGGLTKFGISKNAHPDVDIAALTIDKARLIYHRDYWVQFRCDRMPPVLAMLMFDAAVQYRPRTAITLIQTPIKGIAHDGVMGEQTLAALHAADPQVYVPHHLSYRADFYAGLVAAKSSQAKYLRGWLRRLFLLEARLFELGYLTKVVV